MYTKIPLKRVILPMVALLGAALPAAPRMAHAASAFEPAPSSFQSAAMGAATGPIVDEPLGAHSGLGLTLWHMGRDASAIAGFHDWLKTQKIAPESLLPAKSPATPAATRRILIEPELLSEAQRAAGWRVEGDSIVSDPGDNGPDANIPLKITRAGFYRLWIKFHALPGATGLTTLRIYRVGREGDGPLISDEFYDQPAEREGAQWKQVMLDLPAGDYVVRLGHAIAGWWRAPGAGYAPLRVDSLYLTDEIWDDAPDAAITTLRALPPALQRETSPSLSPAQRALWRRWQVRPISWEDSVRAPKLFVQSRAFWRQRIDELAKKEYRDDAVPNYRAPERQNIFDDRWNMIANPVRLQRQIEALQSDISSRPAAHRFYWLRGGDFQMDGGWHRSETSLSGPYGDDPGVAKAALPIDAAGKYYLWVRFNNLVGYYAPWRVTVTPPTGAAISWDHDRNDYDNEWQRIGATDLQKAGALQFAISMQGYKNPGTYRIIHDFVATTDEKYVPVGSLRPPLALSQYESRMRTLGARGADDFVSWLQLDPYRNPLSQEVWSDTSWPAPATPHLAAGATMKVGNAPVVIARGGSRAVNIGLRGMSDKPTRVDVECGALQSVAGGKRIEGKVRWRAIAFMPFGVSRQAWSPLALLRRPWISIPPRGVAGLWITLDARNVPAGNYIAPITLKSPGQKARTVQIALRVSNIVPQPKRPILINGYTGPPEGSDYVRDFDAHGLNVWNSDISKAEMKKRGIRMLMLPMWSADENVIRERIARLKALGLDYSDWIFTIMDEPSGETEEILKPYLDVAKAVRRVDPKVRLSMNPSEGATAKTFEILDPLSDVWIPYALHVAWNDDAGQGRARRAIFTRKPWLWYTTPVYWDKSPGFPAQLRDQIASVPAQPGDNCLGTAFFAYYYPFRDAWDTSYEYIGDAGGVVLPSRHGPVAMPAQEAIWEGYLHANLGQMIKERADAKDEAARKIIAAGTTADLIGWLEKNPAAR